MTRELLLQQLPPYKGEAVTITDDQTVHDIVNEVLEAHEHFAPYYDKIALYFNQGSNEQIADAIAAFCKKELHYREESEQDQTTMLPAGILTRGGNKKIGVDCKHYSGFAAGILDALNRQGKKINWCYRFASYRLLSSTPHHVFVVVNPGTGNEIWIDPTPKSGEAIPYWFTDKKIKANKMALSRIVAGIEQDYYYPATVGRGSVALSPLINGDNNINYPGTNNKYAGIFNPYMGLSAYMDFEGDKDVNKNEIAAALNAAIAKGPMPGHQVDGDFVQWVYDNSIRSWNFYYPGGVRPGFTAENILPPGYPRPYFTADDKLQFEPNVPLDEGYAEIHILTAWLQDIVNNEAEQPWPVKPREVKEFSQGRKGDNFLFQTRRKRTNFFTAIGKAFEDTVNFLKDGALKIVGSIPRNAFLGLVGINAFNFAGNLAEKITAGEWDKIAAKWKSVGGNPDKLRNTIEDGAKKKPILGELQTIGAEPATSTAALLAAAAPIIAILLQFLDKDGKAKEVLAAAKTYLQTKNPNLDLTAFGFLDKRTGQPARIVIDPADDENQGGGNDDMPGDNNILTMAKRNPLVIAGVGAGLTYFIMNKPGKKKNYVFPLLIGGGIYLLLSQMGGGVDKRAALINWVDTNPGNSPETIAAVKKIFAAMPMSEIDIVYEFVFDYFNKGIAVPQSSPVYSQMIAITNKYGIFN